MKRLAIVMLLAACASAPPAYVSRKEPTLGTTFAGGQATRDYWLTGASQMSPAYHVDFEGVQYIVAVDPLNRIRYIETTDERFRTREGLAIGASEGDVLGAGGGAAVEEPGFGRYANLMSGWSARYGNDGDAHTVISFFKRQ